MSDSHNQNPNARFSIDPDDKGMDWGMQEEGREHIDLSSAGGNDDSDDDSKRQST